MFLSKPAHTIVEEGPFDQSDFAKILPSPRPPSGFSHLLIDMTEHFAPKSVYSFGKDTRMKILIRILVAALACHAMTSSAQIYNILHSFGSQNKDGTGPVTD